MNFIQAMIVPSLVSMGMGSLLVAQHLSFAELGYAAPASNRPITVPSPPAGGALASPVNSPDSEMQRRLAEFPGPGSTVRLVRATTENELSARAVEMAGREDPFLMLIPPAPGSIKLPEDIPVPPKLPPVNYVQPLALPPAAPPRVPPALSPFGPQPPAYALLPPSKGRGVPVVPSAPQAPAAGGKPAAPAPKPFGGDKAPPPEQPQWMVRGIISTGYERICMLEGRAGNNLSARVGDRLSDGSVIEAISNRGVTFIRGGRRFVKIIGGIL